MKTAVGLILAFSLPVSAATYRGYPVAGGDQGLFLGLDLEGRKTRWDLAHFATTDKRLLASCGNLSSTHAGEVEIGYEEIRRPGFPPERSEMVALVKCVVAPGFIETWRRAFPEFRTGSGR